MRYLLFTFLTIVANALMAQQLSTKQRTSLDSLFSGWRSLDRPGLAIGIVKDRETLYTGTFGMANLREHEKIDFNTIFWIASVSKQFTALGITALEKQEKLSVEDNISKHLPELGHLPEVRIKHLLHHTSGLRDGYTLVGMTLKGEKHYDPASVFEMIKKQKTLNFTPGTRYEYVNSNYVLLALIIERVSGTSFANFMKDSVFTKLGLTNTRIYDRTKNENDAVGYYHAGSTYKAIKSFLPAIGSTGVMISLEDALALEKNFQSTSFISLDKQLSSDGHSVSIRYKRGLEHYQLHGKTVVSHFGSDPGFRADILRIPSEKLSVIIFSNAGDYWDLSKNLFDAAGIVLSEPNFITRWHSENTLKSDSAIATRYTGVYLDSTSGSSMRFIKYEKGILRSSSELHGYYAPLKHSSNGTYFKQDNYEYEYRFSGDDLVVKRADGEYRFSKINVNASPADISVRELIGSYYSPELRKTYRITKKKGTLRLSFLRIVHSQLVPIAGNMYYSEFFGINVLSFEKMPDGKTRLLVSRDGIKNLEFIKK